MHSTARRLAGTPLFRTSGVRRVPIQLVWSAIYNRAQTMRRLDQTPGGAEAWQPFRHFLASLYWAGEWNPPNEALVADIAHFPEVLPSGERVEEHYYLQKLAALPWGRTKMCDGMIVGGDAPRPPDLLSVGQLAFNAGQLAGAIARHSMTTESPHRLTPVGAFSKHSLCKVETFLTPKALKIPVMLPYPGARAGYHRLLELTSVAMMFHID
jgi:hypothetical protein